MVKERTFQHWHSEDIRMFDMVSSPSILLVTPFGKAAQWIKGICAGVLELVGCCGRVSAEIYEIHTIWDGVYPGGGGDSSLIFIKSKGQIEGRLFAIVIKRGQQGWSILVHCVTGIAKKTNVELGVVVCIRARNWGRNTLLQSRCASLHCDGVHTEVQLVISHRRHLSLHSNSFFIPISLLRRRTQRKPASAVYLTMSHSSS